MKSEKPQLELLFHKYLIGTATSGELEALAAQIDLMDEAKLKEDLLLSHFSNEYEDIPTLKRKAMPIVNAVWANINNKEKYSLDTNQSNKRPIINMYKYFAAACLFLCFLFTGLYYYNESGFESKVFHAEKSNILPGINGARLILDDGRSFELNRLSTGIIVTETSINYEDGSEIVETGRSKFVVLSTPVGSKYKVTLADGSRIWLNADSKLRYPIKFSKNERRVELKGEGYFEINEVNSNNNPKYGNSKVPFIVTSPGQEVEVLGTKFNIQAYSNDPVKKTSLLQGKIQLRANMNGKIESKILHPGDQAMILGENLSVSSTINIPQQTAWKDGVILLEEQTIGQVLKQIERSYDVIFIFENGITLSNTTLSGELQPNLSLPILLNALEKQSDLKFEQKGRRIMVFK